LENPIPTEDQTLDARVTILEYRQDGSDKGLSNLRTEYTTEHKALRVSLQGIEKNLQAIKWVSFGATLAFLAQAIGLDKALAVAKLFL
jgi:hypothetical protein